MKTNYVSAIVMLFAGGVYCLLGIFYQIPFMDFVVQLLMILIIFWIIGGIIRMVLDRFMGEIEDKSQKDTEENKEDSEETSENVEKKEDTEAEKEE